MNVNKKQKLNTQPQPTRKMQKQGVLSEIKYWVSNSALERINPDIVLAIDNKWKRVATVKESVMRKDVARIVKTGKCNDLRDVPPPEIPSGLSDDYVQTSMKKAMLVLVGYSAAHTASAFLCARAVRDAPRSTRYSIHVDATCSTAGGVTQLFAVLHKLVDALGVNVTLDAVCTTLGFYSRPVLGYEFRRSCAMDARVIDPAPLQNVVANTAVAVKNNLGQFIRDLHNEGLSATTNGACNTRNSDEFVFERNCHIDGFSMTRCGSPKRQGHKRARSPSKTKTKTKTKTKN